MLEVENNLDGHIYFKIDYIFKKSKSDDLESLTTTNILLHIISVLGVCARTNIEFLSFLF